MEDELRKVVKNTGSKARFQVVLSGEGSSLSAVLNPEISASAGCHFDIAFGSIETYYSFPNLDDTNNRILVSSKRWKGWKTFVIGKGCYSVPDINKALQLLFKQEGGENVVQFYPYYNTLRCRMVVAAGAKVDVRIDNSLRTVLGFGSRLYIASGLKEAIYRSPNVVNIMKVNSILVHCDLVGSSYLNGSRRPIIYSFFPDAEPGSKIIERPSQYIYLPVDSAVIRGVNVWLTDQSLNPIDLRGEELTCKLFLREC